jgi:hypothetical protein
MAMTTIAAESVVLCGGVSVPVCALNLLLDLERRGCNVRLDDDGTVLVGPGHLLTDDDKAAITACRFSLRAIAWYCEELHAARELLRHLKAHGVGMRIGDDGDLMLVEHVEQPSPLTFEVRCDVVRLRDYLKDLIQEDPSGDPDGGVSGGTVIALTQMEGQGTYQREIR